jgi:hypothetical protein
MKEQQSTINHQQGVAGLLPSGTLKLESLNPNLNIIDVPNRTTQQVAIHR